MIISELIQELNDIKERWGDLPVFIPHDGHECEVDNRSFSINYEDSFINNRYNKEIIFPKRLTVC